MKVFTIENEMNDIAVHATVQQAKAVANAMRFRSEAALARLAAAWPTSRLVKVWNGLPGVNPVSRFSDRATAVSRIWTALQILAPSEAGVPRQKSSMAATHAAELPHVGIVKASAKTNEQKKSGAAIKAGVPREGSKASRVIAMLRREGGTTVEEIMAATDWQRHTTRAILSAGGSLTKKHGLCITSEKAGEQRKYSVKS